MNCQVCEAPCQGYTCARCTVALDPPCCCIPGCNFEIGDWALPLCNQHMGYAHALYDDYVWTREKAERKRSREEAEQHRIGWIYFILVGDKVKIGYAFDLPRRLKQYPPGSLVLAAHWHAKKADEQALHQRFAQYRVAGREWYRDCPEIRDAAAEIVKKHGKPEQPRWGDGRNRQRNLGSRSAGGAAAVVTGFSV